MISRIYLDSFSKIRSIKENIYISSDTFRKMYPDAGKIISESWRKFPSLREYIFTLNRISDEASNNTDNFFKTYFNPNEDGVAVQDKYCYQ